MQLGVEHGCQVRWLLESWLAKHVSGAREGSQVLCSVSSLPPRQAAVPDYCYLQGLCSVLGMVQSVSLLSNGHTAPGGRHHSPHFTTGGSRKVQEYLKSSNRRIGDRDLPGSV